MQSAGCRLKGRGMADDDRIIVEAARAVRYYLPGLVDHPAEIDTALVTLLERDRSGEDVVDVRKTLAVQGNRRVAPQGAQTRDRLGEQPERERDRRGGRPARIGQSAPSQGCLHSPAGSGHHWPP